MGEYKWEAMEMDYDLFDVDEPTSAMISDTKSCFEKEGLMTF